MKKVLLTVAVLAATQMASAKSLFCGAAKESTPGSQIFDKNIINEQINYTDSFINEMSLTRFVFDDGTVVNGEHMTVADSQKISNTTLVYSITQTATRIMMSISKAQRINALQVNFVDSIMGGSLNSKNTTLEGNNLYVYCYEQQ